MHRITPLRLIGAAVVLGILGGICILATFSVHGGAVFAFFLAGNALWALAGMVGFLGLTSLGVEIGVRAAQRERVARTGHEPASLELRTSGQVEGT